MSQATGQRIHIRVTKQQYEALKKLADAGGYSVSETLRRAIDAYLHTALLESQLKSR